MASFKASYRKTGGDRWEGVVKNEKNEIVWSCGHFHECRDYNHSRYFQHKGAAMRCSTEKVKEFNCK